MAMGLELQLPPVSSGFLRCWRFALARRQPPWNDVLRFGASDTHIGFRLIGFQTRANVIADVNISNIDGDNFKCRVGIETTF